MKEIKKINLWLKGKMEEIEKNSEAVRYIIIGKTYLKEARVRLNNIDNNSCISLIFEAKQLLYLYWDT